jgi:hypothetical protein
MSDGAKVPGRVAGIEVRGDWRVDANGMTRTVCARLSWNGGTSWTAFTALGANPTTTETTYTLGSTSSLWGRTWTASELGNASFRVQIVDVASSTLRDFSLDGLKVRGPTRPDASADRAVRLAAGSARRPQLPRRSPIGVAADRSPR